MKTDEKREVESFTFSYCEEFSLGVTVCVCVCVRKILLFNHGHVIRAKIGLLLEVFGGVV